MISNLSEEAFPLMTIRESKDSDSRKCKAKTAKGLKCKNNHLEGDLYCHVHPPVLKHKKCNGITRVKKQCNVFARKGSKFCQDDHYPDL